MWTANCGAAQLPAAFTVCDSATVEAILTAVTVIGTANGPAGA
jgi:hypothetical protein